MRFVEVEQSKVAFQVDGSGPGLMLVHGTGGNSETNWAPLVANIAETRTVIRPNFSGSGETVDDGRPLTVALLAAQAVAAAEEVGTAPFDLVGFSLGSAIAIYIAAEYPDLVRSVTLIAGLADSADPRFRLEMELWRDLIRTDRRSMARLLLLAGFSPDFLSQMDPQTTIQTIEEIVAENNWEGMARQIELNMTLDVRDQARRITKPAFIIGCTHDQMVPPAHARGLVDMIPNARYLEIDTGHLATLERPAEIAGAILDFVDDVPGALVKNHG
ncbi:alpha/beta fold hydrolase [Azospirillum sp. B4]|uniref:alpha/beta fold hydrolase n=1 Tax=Azospirillum sp. B4 TaxID=95605 RepID=UPI0005CB583B|nr:alpha/beta hydrolase [Azospirillum sp. B4]